MSWIKDLLKPFFASELNRLESCKSELQQCRAEYRALKKNYDTLAEAHIKTPRDFESKSELLAWLSANKIDKLEYVVKTHDCDDFALELQRAALKAGYLINIELDPKGTYYGNGECHMLNGCRIGNFYYIIEPQTDEIIFSVRLD